MGSKVLNLIGLSIAFVLFILLSSIQGAVANHLPAELSSCQVVDLSPCQDFVTGRSTMNPPWACCLRFRSAVRSRCGCRFPIGGAFLAVEQAQSLRDACKLRPEALGRCFDGSRMSASPTESVDGKSAMSQRSLLSEFCSGCKEGDYNLNAPTTPPPTKPPP